MDEVIEIERKFIVSKTPDETHQQYSRLGICQWYEENAGGAIRHRRTYDWVGRGQPLYEKIIKKPSGHGSNIEKTLGRGKSTFWSGFYTHKKVSKTRLVYLENGFKFEFDVFDPGYADFILLEVELDHIDQEINFPDWIKELIIREVTGDSSYNNYNIAK